MPRIRRQADVAQATCRTRGRDGRRLHRDDWQRSRRIRGNAAPRGSRRVRTTSATPPRHLPLPRHATAGRRNGTRRASGSLRASEGFPADAQSSPRCGQRHPAVPAGPRPPEARRFQEASAKAPGRGRWTTRDRRRREGRDAARRPDCGEPPRVRPSRFLRRRCRGRECRPTPRSRAAHVRVRRRELRFRRLRRRLRERVARRCRARLREPRSSLRRPRSSSRSCEAAWAGDATGCGRARLGSRCSRESPETVAIGGRPSGRPSGRACVRASATWMPERDPVHRRRGTRSRDAHPPARGRSSRASLVRVPDT